MGQIGLQNPIYPFSFCNLHIILKIFPKSLDPAIHKISNKLLPISEEYAPLSMFFQILHLSNICVSTWVVNTPFFPWNASIPVTTDLSFHRVDDNSSTMELILTELSSELCSILKSQYPFNPDSILVFSFKKLSSFIFDSAIAMKFPIFPRTRNFISSNYDSFCL